MIHPSVVSYIDPGTGSMLFTILVGVLGAGLYAARPQMLRESGKCLISSRDASWNCIRSYLRILTYQGTFVPCPAVHEQLTLTHEHLNPLYS